MKQYGYEVKINQICVHHEEEDEPYGFWESTYNNTIDPFFKRNDEYPDVTCPYEFKDNDKAYVVWAVWNSGDSFGNSTDGYAVSFYPFVHIRLFFYIHHQNLSKFSRSFPLPYRVT